MSNENGYISSLNELSFHVSETPTAQDRVFSVLLDDADTELTESSIRGLLELPKSTVHAALSALVSDQLVQSRSVGRTKLYWVDIDDPLITMLKTARAIRKVRAAIAPIRDGLDLVVLYGSAARGQDRGGSDVDVLVVADDPGLALDELAQHQWLHPVAITAEEHMCLIAEGSTFASEVARGIEVWQRR